jgi:hypothetical protein
LETRVAPQPEGEWTATLDAFSGVPFYTNTVTHETTWTKPGGGGGEAEVEKKGGGEKGGEGGEGERERS